MKKIHKTKGARAQDVTFILVRPRYPGNIGSTARALKNMGFKKLVLVCPSVLPTHPEALRLAVGAADLLKKAKVVDSLDQGVKGLHFLIGTTRRTGKYRRDFVSLPDLAAHLPAKQKIGILFGAEERGLTNRELAFCNLVATIPADPDFQSLNLAQAVVVVAYELRRGVTGGARRVAGGRRRGALRGSGDFPLPGPAHEGPTVGEIQGMYEHLEKTLMTIGFFPHDNSFHMMRTIRQLFGRTGLTSREVRVLRGICRQVLWSTGRGKDS